MEANTQIYLMLHLQETRHSLIACTQLFMSPDELLKQYTKVPQNEEFNLSKFYKSQSQIDISNTVDAPL